MADSYSLHKIVLIITVMGCLSITGCNHSDKSEKDKTTIQEKTLYQCPMDCENGTTYDKPGKCPVCEMDLEKAPLKS